MSKQKKPSSQRANPEIDVEIGNYEVVIGSILFFWDTTQEAGTWLFLLGSLELLIRPLIRITRNSHLKRLRSTGMNVSKKDY